MQSVLRIGVAFGGGFVVGIAVLLAGLQDPARVVELFVLGAASRGGPLLFAIVAVVTATCVLGVASRRGDRRDPLGLNPPDHGRARALSGAVLVGVGVGLSGFLPTTALVALPAGASGTVVFVASLLVGLLAAPDERDPRG